MMCVVCGNNEGYTLISPVDEKLSSDWELSKGLTRLFNIREGSLCRGCGSNIRAQGLAEAILKSKFGFGARTLKDWVGLANKANLAVCELNSCHQLHPVLSGLNNLTYAEFGTESEQDIEKLTYKDNTFDIILHSETLEHVNDPAKAMEECRRVIKDKGIVLFSTPVIWSRVTKTRAKREGSQVIKVLSSSYHGQNTEDYLVYSEFGKDIGAILGCGVAQAYPKFQNYIFFSNKKREKKISKYQVAHFSLQQKIYERTSS